MAVIPERVVVHCLPEKELLRLARLGSRPQARPAAPEASPASRSGIRGWEDVETMLGLRQRPATP